MGAVRSRPLSRTTKSATGTGATTTPNEAERASTQGFLGISFIECLELLDALIRRERIERNGGTSSEYPSVLQRLGITAAMWEQTVQVTSRRFARELDIMAMMFAEARPRG